MLRSSLVFLVLLCSTRAFAQDRPERLRVDAHGALTWDGGMGVGGYLEVPIYRPPAIAEDLALRMGLDAILWDAHGSTPRQYLPSLVLQWNIVPTDVIILTPELGVAAQVYRHKWNGFVPALALGARFRIVKRVYATIRLGSPVAVTTGLCVNL